MKSYLENSLKRSLIEVLNQRGYYSCGLGINDFEEGKTIEESLNLFCEKLSGTQRIKWEFERSNKPSLICHSTFRVRFSIEAWVKS